MLTLKEISMKATAVKAWWLDQNTYSQHICLNIRFDPNARTNKFMNLLVGLSVPSSVIRRVR